MRNECWDIFFPFLYSAGDASPAWTKLIFVVEVYLLRLSVRLLIWKNIPMFKEKKEETDNSKLSHPTAAFSYLKLKFYTAWFNGNSTFCVTEWKTLLSTNWTWFCKISLSLKLSAITYPVKNLTGFYKSYQMSTVQRFGKGLLRLDGRTLKIDFKFEILFTFCMVKACLHLLPLSTQEH